MRNLSLFFSLFCLAILLNKIGYAQNSYVKGKVLDANTKKGVPYASIIVPGKYATVADSIGQFNFPKKKLDKEDTIEIKSIGYHTLKISFKNDTFLVFRLQPKPVKINEVVIKPFDLKEIERIGPTYNKKNCTWSHVKRQKNLPFQIAILLKPKQEGDIQSVSFYISKYGQPKTKFRVNLYKKGFDKYARRIHFKRRSFCKS